MSLDSSFNVFWPLFLCLQNKALFLCDQGSRVFRNVNFWGRMYVLNSYSSTLPVDCGHLTGLLEGMNEIHEEYL